LLTSSNLEWHREYQLKKGEVSVAFIHPLVGI